ncbi:MAG TPA: thiamine phosphate synthase [Candidatus Angelobacter sp.]
MNGPNQLPRFYPIVDAARFSAAPDPAVAIARFARELVAGGASLIQYRNKSGNPRPMLSQARELRRVIQDKAKLIMNDRADLCLAAGFDGVHLGQDDLSPGAVRQIFQDAGQPRLWIGFSTHNPDQLREADQMLVDYIAVGPVFATTSKANPDPVIGVEGVRRAREATKKPLVAIGGITRQNCKSVLDGGADAVAVISDVVESPGKSAEEFLRILG